MIKGDKPLQAFLHPSWTRLPSKIQDKKHRGPATLLFCTVQSVQLQFLKISDVFVECFYKGVSGVMHL